MNFYHSPFLQITSVMVLKADILLPDVAVRINAVTAVLIITMEIGLRPHLTLKPKLPV